MRCPNCGWILRVDECPCRASRGAEMSPLAPVGARVLARAGRGPSMDRWEWGTVATHAGRLHQVRLERLLCWCEADDLVLERTAPDDLLVSGTRVWGLWLDGRFYPGTIDRVEEHLRYVVFDDEDRMWLDSRQLYVMVVSSAPLRPGCQVLVRRWDGDSVWATLEHVEGDRCRVAFDDGDESWLARSELRSPAPNPFLE